MFEAFLFNGARRIISLFLILSLAFSPALSYAQNTFVTTLPEPGKMVGVSPVFTPVLVKGLVVHPDQPLNFDFIVDSGNDSAEQAVVQAQSEKIVRYFLAALTVPEEQLWVNLSPYEKDRIIDDGLGQTVLGRDMLAQDYVLKQLTASLIYPEDNLGKDFWGRIYKEAQDKFGTTDIPVDTFNKVWIVPQKAEVFEKDNSVYVTEARLKVMLDSDYVAASHSEARSAEESQGAADLSKSLIRQVILPAIEKEVNEGKNFATLRQIYHAAILAKWYRELIQDTLMSKAYVGQNKISGVNSDDKTLKEQIYQRYIAAYKQGVFNYIKDETDVVTGETTPRKYFSGGLDKFGDIKLDKAQSSDDVVKVGKVFKVDFAMSDVEGRAESQDWVMLTASGEGYTSYDGGERATSNFEFGIVTRTEAHEKFGMNSGSLLGSDESPYSYRELTAEERSRHEQEINKQKSSDLAMNNSVIEDVAWYKKAAGALGLNWLAYRALKSKDSSKIKKAIRYFGERKDKRAVQPILDVMSKAFDEANEALLKLGVGKDVILQKNLKTLDGQYSPPRRELIIALEKLTRGDVEWSAKYRNILEDRLKADILELKNTPSMIPHYAQIPAVYEPNGYGNGGPDWLVEPAREEYDGDVTNPRRDFLLERIKLFQWALDRIKGENKTELSSDLSGNAPDAAMNNSGSALMRNKATRGMSFKRKLVTWGAILALVGGGVWSYKTDYFQARSLFNNVSPAFAQSEYWYPRDISARRVVIGDINSSMDNHGLRLETQPLNYSPSFALRGTSEFEFRFKLTNISVEEQEIRKVVLIAYGASGEQLKAVEETPLGNARFFNPGMDMETAISVPINEMVKQVSLLVVREDNKIDIFAVAGADKLFERDIVNQNKSNDRAMSNIQVTSSALSANVLDAAMVNEVIQWIVDNQKTLIIVGPLVATAGIAGLYAIWHRSSAWYKFIIAWHQGDYPREKLELITAIGARKDKRAINALMNVLLKDDFYHPYGELRWAAVKAIGGIKDPLAEKALLKAVSMGNFEALEFLVNSGFDPAKLLDSADKFRPTDSMSQYWYRMLNKINDVRVQPLLINVLQNNLETMSGPRLFDLLKLIKNPSDDIQKKIFRAVIKKYNNNKDEIKESIRRLVQLNDRDGLESVLSLFQSSRYFDVLQEAFQGAKILGASDKQLINALEAARINRHYDVGAIAANVVQQDLFYTDPGFFWFEQMKMAEHNHDYEAYNQGSNILSVNRDPRGRDYYAYVITTQAEGYYEEVKYYDDPYMGSGTDSIWHETSPAVYEWRKRVRSDAAMLQETSSALSANMSNSTMGDIQNVNESYMTGYPSRDGYYAGEVVNGWIWEERWELGEDWNPGGGGLAKQWVREDHGNRRDNIDASMGTMQETSSALSANSPDASMVNDVLQWVQSNGWTIAGVVASLTVASVMARNWWLKNTIAGNIKRAGFLYPDSEVIAWLMQHNAWEKLLRVEQSKLNSKDYYVVSASAYRISQIVPERIQESKARELLETVKQLAIERVLSISENFGRSEVALLIKLGASKSVVDMARKIDEVAARLQIKMHSDLEPFYKGYIDLFRQALEFSKQGYDFDLVLHDYRQPNPDYDPYANMSDINGVVLVGTAADLPPFIDVGGETHWEIIRGDKLTENSMINSANGGIDIQNIDVNKTGNARIQFNDDALKQVLSGGFDGFTPVFIKMTPLESPLMALGVN